MVIKEDWVEEVEVGRAVYTADCTIESNLTEVVDQAGLAVRTEKVDWFGVERRMLRSTGRSAMGTCRANGADNVTW